MLNCTYIIARPPPPQKKNFVLVRSTYNPPVFAACSIISEHTHIEYRNIQHYTHILAYTRYTHYGTHFTCLEAERVPCPRPLRPPNPSRFLLSPPSPSPCSSPSTPKIVSRLRPSWFSISLARRDSLRMGLERRVFACSPPGSYHIHGRATAKPDGRYNMSCVGDFHVQVGMGEDGGGGKGVRSRCRYARCWPIKQPTDGARGRVE